jgi:hypothetical protein
MEEKISTYSSEARISNAKVYQSLVLFLEMAWRIVAWRTTLGLRRRPTLVAP